MKGYLGRFAHRSQKHQQGGGGKEAPPDLSTRSRLGDLTDAQGTELVVQENQGDDEARIADAVNNKGLHPRPGLGLILKPEADKQVRAQADPFPPQEHEDQVIGQHQVQHHESEQVQEGKVAPDARVATHITDGINMD
ncbi:hypothetical protein ES703_25131 [subsurface metagenome]